MTPTPGLPEQAQRFQQTTKAFVIAAYVQQLSEEIATLTLAKAADYKSQWERYKQQRDERPAATNIVEPVPVLKEVIVYDADGWPNRAPGKEEVCPRFQYVPPVTQGPNPILGGGGVARDPRYAAVNSKVGDIVDNGDGAFWYRVPAPAKGA
jgi:hypothetical protein